MSSNNEATRSSNHRLTIQWFLVVSVLLVALGAQGQSRSPNVIILFADDLGYGDVGCYGSKTIATPRIDRMARQGARCTDFYSAAPFCSPSRAALLTGRLPVRSGLPYVLFPAEHNGLPPDEITLAELLKSRGYATACIGKWHLGWDPPFRPQQQGFDEFFGLPYSNDSIEWQPGEAFMQVMSLEPLPLMDGNRVIEAPVDQATLTQRYTDRTIEFIRKHREQPFFIYLPHTMPHIPQYASQAFAGKSKGGLYGDCIEELDSHIGRLLDTLSELKLAENTLVIFTSDNGASLQNPAAQKKGRFGERGNGGSNVPLRGAKGTTFEGGIRVPAIFWWPGRIAKSELTQPLSMMDIFPTVAQLAGAALPSGRVIDGMDIGPALLGKSTPRERTLYHYFGVQLQAVRQGNWKLFVPIESLPEPRPASLWFEHVAGLFERQHRLLPKPQLFDLQADIAEKNDLAGQHPEIVERLLKQARDFNAQLQRDKRSMEFVPGPPPPKPGQIRQPGESLDVWLQARRYER